MPKVGTGLAGLCGVPAAAAPAARSTQRTFPAGTDCWLDMGIRASRGSISCGNPSYFYGIRPCGILYCSTSTCFKVFLAVIATLVAIFVVSLVVNLVLDLRPLSK